MPVSHPGVRHDGLDNSNGEHGHNALAPPYQRLSNELNQSNQTTEDQTLEFRVSCLGAPTRRLRLTGNRYTLGSASGCSIQLSDPSLRPMHAVLIRDAHRLVVRAYSIPIEVNSTRTTECTLHLGDTLRLGNYHFELIKLPTFVPETNYVGQQFVDADERESGGRQHSEEHNPPGTPPCEPQPEEALVRDVAKSTLALAEGLTQSAVTSGAMPHESEQEWRDRLRQEVQAWRDRQSECDRRESELRSRETELWQRAEEIHRREADLLTQEVTTRDIEEDYKKKTEEVFQLRQQHEQHQRLLEEQASKHEALRASDLQNLEETYRLRVADATRQLTESQDQVRIANESIHRMREQFNALKEQLESLSANQSVLQADEQRGREEQEQLRLTLEASRQEAEASRDEAVEAREASEALRLETEARLAEVTAELEEIRRQRESSQQEINENASTVQSLRNQITQLQQDVDQASEESSQWRENYTEAVESVKHLEMLLTETRDGHEKERESWVIEAESLQASVDSLSVELANARRELSELCDANNELSEKLEAAHSERDQARRELEVRPTNEAWQSLRDELAQASEQISLINQNQSPGFPTHSALHAEPTSTVDAPLVSHDDADPYDETSNDDQESRLDTEATYDSVNRSVADDDISPTDETASPGEQMSWSTEDVSDAINQADNALLSDQGNEPFNRQDASASDWKPVVVHGDDPVASKSDWQSFSNGESGTTTEVPSETHSFADDSLTDNVGFGQDAPTPSIDVEDSAHQSLDSDTPQSLDWQTVAAESDVNNVDALISENNLVSENSLISETSLEPSDEDLEGDQLLVEQETSIESETEEPTTYTADDSPSNWNAYDAWKESGAVDQNQPNQEIPSDDDPLSEIQNLVEIANYGDPENTEASIEPDPTTLESDDDDHDFQHTADASGQSWFNPASSEEALQDVDPAPAWSSEPESEPENTYQSDGYDSATPHTDSENAKVEEPSGLLSNVSDLDDEKPESPLGSFASQLINDIEAEQSSSGELDAPSDPYDSDSYQASGAHSLEDNEDAESSTYAMDEPGANENVTNPWSFQRDDEEVENESALPEQSPNAFGINAQADHDAAYQSESHDEEQSPQPIGSYQDAEISTAEVSPEQASESAEEGTADDDDSIEAYMNRLLKRVQGEPTDSVAASSTSGMSSVSTTDSVTTAPEDPSLSTSSSTTPLTMESDHGSEYLDPDEPLVPRSQAPERSGNLSAMRELANQSARSAISRSVRIQSRDIQIKAFTKFGAAAVAVVCAFAVLLFIVTKLKFIAAGAIFVLAFVMVSEGRSLLKESRRRLEQADTEAESDPAADSVQPEA